MKLNTKKFIRNIIICLIAWLVVSFILNYAPGFKRDKFADVTNLIIDDEDLTENLNHNIYISENGVIYLSIQDIENMFDKNIYYDEEFKTIITTSNTKTAIMSLEDSKIIINGIEQNLQSKVLKMEEIIYIPISELELVYNISTKYVKDTDIVVIENLNKGLIKATVEEGTTVKFKPRSLSKNVGEINKGDVVSCYYTTSKGWRLIRKEDGTLGYVKANVLADEYIVRQDFDDEIKTAELITDLEDGSILNLYNNQETEKIMIKTLFNFEANGTIYAEEENIDTDNYAIWATISNKGLEKYTNELIKNYKTRTELIDKVVNFVTKYRVRGMNIDFQKVDDQNSFDRFIIELAPRLRELGITTNVILNNSFEEANLVGVVDYLISEKGE
ncbi:MAG: stalk domain-containing protein [Clostridia bacterium]